MTACRGRQGAPPLMSEPSYPSESARTFILENLAWRAPASRTHRFSLPGSAAQILCSIVGLSLFSMTAFAEIERPAGTNTIGFTAASAANQQALEAKFDARLDPADQRAWPERMSAEPNHVVSPHNKANAEFMLEKFREWGWDAQIETFYVLYPTPIKQALEMVAPTPFTARRHEPAVEGDRTSDKTRDALPPYHVYGADGDVTGELVYVNQGMPDDYKELDRHGISVKGRIVVTRYGGG